MITGDYKGQFGQKNGPFGRGNGQFAIFLKLKSPPLPPFGVELPYNEWVDFFALFCPFVGGNTLTFQVYHSKISSKK